MDQKYLKRLRFFTVAYMVVSIIMLIGSACGIILFAVLHHVIPAEFVYYGNDAVSGWATIFSGIGYLAGLFGRFFMLALIIACVFAAVYWIIGLVLNHYLKASVERNDRSCRGVGTALSVWTILPGAGIWIGILSTLLREANGFSGLIPGGLTGAVYLAAGIFLLLSVYEKG